VAVTDKKGEGPGWLSGRERKYERGTQYVIDRDTGELRPADAEEVYVDRSGFQRTVFAAKYAKPGNRHFKRE
jgi:hypothetical protein